MQKTKLKVKQANNQILSYLLAFFIAIFLTSGLEASVCTGDITLTSQAEVDNFNPCDTIIGSLFVEGADINDLTPLDEIEHVSEVIFIRENPQLTQIQDGFKGLLSAGNLVFSNFMTIEKVDGFNNLVSLGSLLFDNPEALQSISGFNALETTGGFQITNASSLSTLEGFSSLTTVGNIVMRNNPNLNNLDIFSLTTGSIDNLFLQNSGLVDLDGLSGITEINRDLFIEDIAIISDFDFLSNLTKVERNLVVTGNTNLENIDGLANITESPSSIRISNNPMLSLCCGINPVLSEAVIAGSLVLFENNLAGCNSPFEVFSSCAILSCTDNVIINSQEELEDFAEIGCDSLFGNLLIQGSVIDLAPLNFIKYIEGSLAIQDADELQTIEGFNNLTYIGQSLTITGDRMSITSINGFQNLEIIEFDLLVFDQNVFNDENNLIEINGFQKLNTVREVSIRNNPIEDINGFDILESVNGFSVVGSNVTNLNFLSSLKNVTDFIFLSNNNSLLSLSGLNNLEKVGSLGIAQNDLLSNIEDLESLEEIEQLRIFGNPELRICCTVSSFVSENTQVLADIEFNGTGCRSADEIRNSCMEIDCSTDVQLNSQEEINNWTGCEEVLGRMFISGDDIVDLTPLSSLQSIFALEIAINPNLNSLEGLENLTSISNFLSISNNPSLTDLSALSSLRSVNSITIRENQMLSDLNGLQNVESTDFVNIDSNQNLQNIDGLIGLNSLGFFQISANPSIQNVDGLINITTLDSGLSISLCPQLENLSGLQNLTSVAVSFNISSTNLSSLDDLNNLESINGSLSIHSNPNLNSCCSIASPLNELVNNGTAFLRIENNADGCNSVDEVLASCGITNCMSDVNITSQAELVAFAQTGCDTLYGNLIIVGDGITDLSPLNFIKYIGGALSIVNTGQLQTIEGFNNLTFIGQGLNIPTGGESITSINGFQNLETIAEFDLLIIGHENLTEINGFQNLTTVRDIIINGNPIAEINGFGKLESVNSFSFVDSKVTNLDFLESLKNVETSITIASSDELLNIQGLSTLQNINGDITIAGNSKLADLNGLNNLETVGTLRISDNTSLSTLESLEFLINIELLIIHGNSALSMCCPIFPFLSEDSGTFVDISNNANGCTSVDEVKAECGIDDCNADVRLSSQEEVNNWLGCEEVVGTLTISGDDITDLSPLSTLKQANALFILNNPLLNSLDGLENLSEVDITFVVFENESLNDISALNALTDVGDFFYFLSNPALTNLNGLENLATVGDFFIDNNESLQNIDALSNLTTINGLFEILDSPSLQNVDGLSNVTSIEEGFILANCPVLESISGLQNVNSINGRIVISGTGVSSLAGLENIEFVVNSNGNTNLTNSVSIDSNPNLTNLNALSNLLEISGNLSIVNNVNLTDCCGIFPLLNGGTITGTIDISGNPSPCSTQNQIFATCGNGTGGTGGTDTNVEGVDLSLAITSMHDTYVPFKDMTFTISLSNFGTESAEDIVVDIPEASQQLGSGNFAYTWHSLDDVANARGNFDPNFTKWNISYLDPGETVSMDVVLYVLAENQVLPVFTQIVSSFPQDADATPNNDTNGIADEDDEASAIIIPVENNTIFTDLELNVTADKRNVLVDETVNIFIQLNNKSTEDASNITIAPLQLLSELGITSNSTTAGNFDDASQIWTIPVMPRNSSATLQLVTTVQAIAGALTYSWQLTSVDQKERDSSPNNGFGNNLDHEDDEGSITLFELTDDTSTDFPDLELSLDCDSPIYTAGTLINYTLTVTNTGTAPANDVIIDWPLPTGLAHADLVVSKGVYSSWSGIWNLQEALQPGESAEVLFEVYTQIGDRDITSYAQVISLEEFDMDSTPGNGICCQSLEDDEAIFTIAPAIGNVQGRSSLATNTEFELYPNPTSDRINLTFEATNENSEIEIINLQGQVVMQRDLQHGDGQVSISLDVNQLPSGLYYLRLLYQDYIEPVSFIKE